MFCLWNIKKGDNALGKIGERIISLRKKYHMTQAQLGEITGLHGSNISRIEKGLVIPNGDTVRKMADYFNVSCDYILSKNENRADHTVGYILCTSDNLLIVENAVNARLSELKQLYSVYQQLDDRNRQEILEYMKIKIKYQK